jgi:hypothetical protein
MESDVAQNFAVPASLPIEPDSLTRAVPCARQRASASSDSTRLHLGHRFILVSGYFGVSNFFNNS